MGGYVFRYCTNLTIYCEASSQPEGWDSNWNYMGGKVSWGKNNHTVGLAYQLINGDTEYAVTGIGTATDTNIVIPSTYNDLPVTAIGNWAFDNRTNLTSVTIPDSVTAIGNYAFNNCTNLTSVTIPNSIKSIGQYAFFGTAIRNNTPNNSVVYADKWAVDYKGVLDVVVLRDDTVGIADYAFDNCTNLTSITIPDSVVSIGGWVFASCASLGSVTIGNSVASIGERAFINCTSLKTITIPYSVIKMGGYVFYNTTSLKIYCETPFQPMGWDSNWNYMGGQVSWGESNYTEGLTYQLIKNGTEYEVSGMLTTAETNVIIPSKYQGLLVTSIAETAFYGNSRITSVIIPSVVTNIGEAAFGGCVNLTTITVSGHNQNYSSLDGVLFNKDQTTLIRYPSGKTDTVYTVPNSVINIGTGAFYNCGILTSIIIQSGVENIDAVGIRACVNLASIVVDEANLNYSSLDGVLFNKDKTTLVSYAIGKTETAYTIPNTVSTIAYGAFFNCTNLSSITIPNSVASIENWAFYNCVNLGSATIPNSVVSIGSYVFYNCTSLGSVTIPDSVVSMGSNAFDETPIWFNAPNNSVVYVGKWAVGYKGNLGVVVLRDDTVGIVDLAFSHCDSLTSITIPDSVVSIGNEVFYNCTSLASIVVDEANPNYSSQDGVLFNKDKTILICYPSGKTDKNYSIPNSVTIIGKYAFFNNASLQSIAIPNSVTSIGYASFVLCSSLTAIIIPDSVVNIGELAFYYSENLTIYCVASSQPDGWDDNWNPSNRPVVWGYVDAV